MYTIKEFAEILQLKVSTIRYYERVGLLTPRRAENGYRLYQQEEIERVQYILVMKYAAFSIEEMKQMFALMVLPVTPACEFKTEQLISSKEQEISRKIARFSEVLALLATIKPLTSHHEFEEVQPQINEAIGAIYQKIVNEERLK